MAAVLSQPQAIVGHRSAAHLLGLYDIARGSPTIVVPKGSNTRSGLAQVIESDQFARLATTTVGAFQVTTVPETMLALAADLEGEQLTDLFDAALLAGKLDLKAQFVIFDREVGRRPRGIKHLRQLALSRLPTAPSHGSSYLEAMLERVLKASQRLPAWTREYPFTVNGSEARVDVFIPDWSLVVESDGRNWHMRNQAFESDRARDIELATGGLQVLRFTYDMLLSDSHGCLDQILKVGSVRTAQRFA